MEAVWSNHNNEQRWVVNSSDSDGKLTEEEYQTMLQSLEDADTKHTTKMLRKILENLPDGTGNEKGVELVQVKPAQRK